MAKKSVSLKDQYYKLGDKANQFVDQLSGTKILQGQVVKVEGNRNKSGKLKSALAGQHIVRVDEDDYNEYLQDQKDIAAGKTPIKKEVTVEDEFAGDSEEVRDFRKLSDTAKRKQITDEYELDADDKKNLKEAKGEEIVTIFKSLVEGEEEAEEEADDDLDDDDEK